MVTQHDEELEQALSHVTLPAGIDAHFYQRYGFRYIGKLYRKSFV